MITVDINTLATTDTSYELNDGGQPVELETLTGSCAEIAKSGQSADQAAAGAIAQATQAPAPFISFAAQPRKNTICARDDRPTSTYSAVTWCVSTAASPQGGASFEGLAAGSSIQAVAVANGASLEKS